MRLNIFCCSFCSPLPLRLDLRLDIHHCWIPRVSAGFRVRTLHFIISVVLAASLRWQLIIIFQYNWIDKDSVCIIVKSGDEREAFTCAFGRVDRVQGTSVNFFFSFASIQVNEFLASRPDGVKKDPMSMEAVAMGFLNVANETMCRPIRALTQVGWQMPDFSFKKWN